MSPTPPTPPTPPKAKPFLTVIPGRTPETKAHTSIGHAKNAVGSAWWGGGKKLFETIDGVQTGRSKYSYPVRGGEVWELVDGEWVLLYNIPPKSFEHDLPWRSKEYEGYLLDDGDDLV